MHTITNVSAVGQPSSERDSRDLETRAAEATVLHLWKVFWCSRHDVLVSSSSMLCLCVKLL